MPDPNGETRWYFPRRVSGRRDAVVTLHVRYNVSGSSYCDPSDIRKLTGAFITESAAKGRKGLRLCGNCLRSINGRQ